MKIDLTDKFILDACCGGRMIWFNKHHKNTLYIDIRRAEKGICKERPNFEVKPDIIMDFRALDLPNNHFKLIVWDPPHLNTLTKTSIMFKKYGCLNNETWRYDLNKGFNELWRVLKPEGILIFKWNEEAISLKECLKQFPIAPLLGHTTGSKSKTRWLCFMKIP